MTRPAPLAGVCVALLAAAAGCGDSEPNPVPAFNPSLGNIDDFGGDWMRTTDPATGRSFHCLFGYARQGDSGGPYIWCYEPGAEP